MTDALYDSYMRFIGDFYDFIRWDPVIMSILSVLCLFKERVGISNRDAIQRERTLFMELLDKYIRAKVEVHWTGCTVQGIWDHIHNKMVHVSSIKSLFENVALKALGASTPIQDFTPNNIPM